MARLQINVLGPLLLEVEGKPVGVPPLSARALALLVAADGDSVASSRMHQELWPASGHHSRRDRSSRTEVQQRILALRRLLDAEGVAPEKSVVRTEPVVVGSESESAYRLVCGPDEIDAVRFERLVVDAMAAGQSASRSCELLQEALELWRGDPLVACEPVGFVADRMRRLHGLYESACSELIQIQTELGRIDEALATAVRIADRRPQDPQARAQVAELRGRLRARRGDELLQRQFTGLRARLSVVRGDLFEQKAANLVVGFCDTFDTSTERNELISAESVQGQLLHRLYGGDVKTLDRELRRGLRGVVPVVRESPRDKPKGKRTRYPVGTVVALPHEDRWIFGVAYTRQRNDLVGESSREELRLSLEQLWVAIGRRGQLKPVAIPLVGSRLSRVPGVTGTELLLLIVDTFVRAGWTGSVAAQELRIVLRQEDLETVDLPAVERYLSGLDEDGRRVGE
ncbi:transcriptional regulator, SARP family [Catenulispora acidiphila DSM 44928]|uniref:Transcriptional regulator, SARP family n=1 Tax=Catenulispora acidiphila (strain DSM 44928 / JCM 14897 / NBRC 102108 / NRRL B-24433 / ID139908) TaxID=479433 RepID=C7PYD5_CATAD|nr:macro domain-containing protein [Catenulispora acidiphila]ACU75425.1 transcriptional regulator, SARP family [Catenulispora acidiphila DSM 44928]